MSKSVSSLAMAYIVSFHFEFCKRKRDMSLGISLFPFYIDLTMESYLIPCSFLYVFRSSSYLALSSSNVARRDLSIVWRKHSERAFIML